MITNIYLHFSQTIWDMKYCLCIEWRTTFQGLNSSCWGLILSITSFCVLLWKKPLSLDITGAFFVLPVFIRWVPGASSLILSANRPTKCYKIPKFSVDWTNSKWDCLFKFTKKCLWNRTFCSVSIHWPFFLNFRLQFGWDVFHSNLSTPNFLIIWDTYTRCTLCVVSSMEPLLENLWYLSKCSLSERSFYVTVYKKNEIGQENNKNGDRGTTKYTHIDFNIFSLCSSQIDCYNQNPSSFSNITTLSLWFPLILTCPVSSFSWITRSLSILCLNSISTAWKKIDFVAWAKVSSAPQAPNMTSIEN